MRSSGLVFFIFENRTATRPVRKMRTGCNGGGVIRFVWCEPDANPSSSHNLLKTANRIGKRVRFMSLWTGWRESSSLQNLQTGWYQTV